VEARLRSRAGDPPLVLPAIAALGLAPAAKKGPCNYYANYYAASDVAKIKKALG
jgi:hypothetical protein